MQDSTLSNQTCKAVVIHGPGKASLDEIAIPQIEPEDVLIKVAYEAICATDIEILDGILGYYKSGLAKYPIIPGHEFSGRITQVGADAGNFQESDAVVAECIQSCGECKECRKGNFIACNQRKELGVIGLNGGYAEYVVVPGRFVHKLPRELSLKKACLCELMAVVLKGIKRLERTSRQGQHSINCAVVGVGPFGHLCALILSRRGYRVTVFDRNPLRRTYFEGTSIKTGESLDELADFEVLVEVTGDPESLDRMLHNSSAGTTLLLLGLPYSRREFSFESIVAYDKTIIGSVGSSAEDFEDATYILPQLELHHFTETVLSLDKFEKGWNIVRQGQKLKILLEVNEQL